VEYRQGSRVLNGLERQEHGIMTKDQQAAWRKGQAEMEAGI
jgi:hypothetical protein